jgi:hypothetical protein
MSGFVQSLGFRVKDSAIRSVGSWCEGWHV